MSVAIFIGRGCRALLAGRGSMRSSAWLRAALLASSVHATLVAHEDGSVTAIQSMARKHFGRRSVELDVTGARLVIIAQEDDVEPSAADYGGAVVLIKPRPACACLSVSAHALHSRSATSPDVTASLDLSIVLARTAQGATSTTTKRS